MLGRACPYEAYASTIAASFEGPRCEDVLGEYTAVANGRCASHLQMLRLFDAQDKHIAYKLHLWSPDNVPAM